MKSILLTGATGFIGRHLVSHLLEDGYNVFITLEKGEDNPFESEVKLFYFNQDILEENVEKFRRNRICGVIHLAAYVQSGTHNIGDISRLISSNILFGAQMLECAADANVKWFINTGTYWQNYQNADYSPVNLYAATKKAFEDIARYYIETNRIEFCTLKLFDTYGFGDTRPKIFNLWNRISETGENMDMSPGEQIIDISHVDDIVSAFNLLSKHLQENNPEVKNGDVFAVKAIKRYTLKELAAIFEQETGRKLKINWGGRPYRDREVMEPWINGKIVPGWQPNVTIKDGIRSLYTKRLK